MVRTCGLRVKSGRVIAVIVESAPDAWRVTYRAEVLLAPDEGPYARFPYHPLVELTGAEAAATSRRAVAAVRSTAKKHMTAFLKTAGAIDAATIVVGSLAVPDGIANPHIRAHAREGELFRTVVARALDGARVPCEFLCDKDAYTQAAKRRGSSEESLRREVAAAGRGVVKPWRSDEKLAAVGGLLSASLVPRGKGL